MKKKKNEPLPRDEYVQFTVDARESGKIEITLNEDGDIDKVLDMEAGSAIHDKSYQGKNKPRKLSLITGGDNPSFHLETFMFNNYERIYFIDTNNSIFRKKKSCCTAVFELINFKDVLRNRKGRVTIEFLIGYYLFEVSEKVCSEKIGWHLFIESTKKFITSLPEGKKAILITDHELGNLDSINKKKKPYYKEFYLPKNLILGYAKADKGSSLIERGVKVADKKSNELKDYIRKKENEPLILMKLKDENNYRGFITINKSQQGVHLR